MKRQFKKWAARRFLTLAGAQSALDMMMDYDLSGPPSITGRYIGKNEALSYSAFYACIRVLAETVGYLPLHLYRRHEPRGRERAREHPVYKLLHDRPNPEMSAYVWKEAMQGHLGVLGNAYSEIEFGSNGRPKHLWPLRPDKMQVTRDAQGGIKYIYTLPNGEEKMFSSFKIFHLKGLGYNGLVGYTPISMHKNTVSIGLDVEEYGAAFYASGGKPGGVLEHPGVLSPKAQSRLTKGWSDAHQGLKQQHRIAILEEGMSYKQVSIPPNDAQFLDSRKYQKGEMAAIYRIPPHMVGDLDRATWNNIEHMGQEFITLTMGPWLTRWEQEVKMKLLLESEWDNYYAEFLTEALLKGDTKTRYEAYSIGRNNGWLSANDIREKENQNPLPGKEGDVYLIPMNMIPASEAVKPVKPTEPTQSAQDSSQAAHRAVSLRGRGGKVRHDLAEKYEPIFQDAIQRITNREVKDIKRAAKKHLKNRDSQDFKEWLSGFYREAPEWIQKIVAPAVKSLTDTIQDAAAKEVGAKPGMTEELEKLFQDLTRGLGVKYTSFSFGQLRKVLEKAEAEAEDLEESIGQRLGEWDENRAEKAAKHEAVYIANDVATHVFTAAGVTRFVWITAGSNTCPYCAELSGKVVGVGQPFVGAKESLESEDGRMGITKPAFHGPLHNHCECTVEPSR